MFDADTYRKSFESADRDSLRKELGVLLCNRFDLNDEVPITEEQVERIEDDLAIIKQKLQIIRALM